MSDYPFRAGDMLWRLAFYLPSAGALFGIFWLLGRSRWRGTSWRHLFEALNVAGFSTLFIALWFLCGISSMGIDEVRRAIGPIVLLGCLFALASWVVYSKKLEREAAPRSGPPPAA